LAAYRNSEFYTDDDGTEHTMPATDGAIGVHLREDGYSVYEARADEAVYKSFLHVAWVARMADDMKRKDQWLTEAAQTTEGDDAA
jgi:hypothetical protein